MIKEFYSPYTIREIGYIDLPGSRPLLTDSSLMRLAQSGHEWTILHKQIYVLSLPSFSVPFFRAIEGRGVIHSIALDELVNDYRIFIDN